MRKFKITALVALFSAFSILLSGCSFSIISVEKLVRPPYPSNDLRYVQEAFYEEVDNFSTLLTPQTGEYRTSFLLYDVDADKEEEALVFYLGNDGNTYMNVLKKSENKWKTESVCHGYGNTVDFVNFIDMNSDDIPEILVGWSRVDSATVGKFFSVFAHDTLSKSFKIRSLVNENYTLMTTADVDNDNDTDILITMLDTSQPVPKAYARMFSYQDGIDLPDNKSADTTPNVADYQSGVPVVTPVNDISLDGNITSYYRMYSESTETENIFYIDAYKGDSQMITEVLVCEKTPQPEENGIVEKKALEAPLIDKTTQTMSATWRGFNMPARDIDGDGNVEIPVQTVIDTNDSSAIDQVETEIGLTNWVRYRNGKLETVKSSFVSTEGDYYIFVPDDIVTQVKAKSSKINNTMTVYTNTRMGTQTELLYIREFSKAHWESLDKTEETGADYTFLYENQNSNMVYAYKLTLYGQSDFGLTAKYVEDNFVMNV